MFLVFVAFLPNTTRLRTLLLLLTVKVGINILCIYISTSQNYLYEEWRCYILFFIDCSINISLLSRDCENKIKNT